MRKKKIIKSFNSHCIYTEKCELCKYLNELCKEKKALNYNFIANVNYGVKNECNH